MEQPLVGERAGGVRGWRPAVTFGLLLGYFGLFGTIIGAQGVLWAEIVPALRLSEGVFGSAQLVSPLIAVGILLLGGQFCAWIGKKRLAVLGLLLLAGSVLVLASAGNVWGLVGALLVAGAGNGMLETAMNAATLDWEQATRRNVMNVMHAGFSGGAVVGAFSAGALLESSWTYSQVLVALAGLCGLVLLATLPVRYPPIEAQADDVEVPVAALRLILSRPALGALALLSLLGIVGESVAFTWSVIYLRTLGADVFVGGAAFALFNGSMFVGRLANAPLVARLGPRISLFASGIGLVGATLLLLTPGPLLLAIVAFVVLGLAVAGVVPTVLSAAARLMPHNNGAIVGGMMAAAYAGFIVCPPLIGWLAEIASLRAALLTVGLSGLGILWLTRGIRS